MGKKTARDAGDEVDTGAITREKVIESFTLEEMKEMMEAKRRVALPRLLERVKQLLQEEGLTLGQLVQHALQSGALEGFVEEGEGSYSKPVYINPDDAHDIYKGSGPQPDWLVEKVKKGHHYFEFRSDRPLRGHIWRNPENPKEVWRGEGVMPKWLYEQMFWPGGQRRPREHILRIAEEEGR